MKGKLLSNSLILNPETSFFTDFKASFQTDLRPISSIIITSSKYPESTITFSNL